MGFFVGQLRISAAGSPLVHFCSTESLPTFVVHVGGHLHHAEAQVDWQVVEVVVGLQDEFPAQLNAVSHLVHLINQHRIEVFILEMRNKVRVRITPQVTSPLGNMAAPPISSTCWLELHLRLSHCDAESDLSLGWATVLRSPHVHVFIGKSCSLDFLPGATCSACLYFIFRAAHTEGVLINHRSR